MNSGICLAFDEKAEEFAVREPKKELVCREECDLAERMADGTAVCEELELPINIVVHYGTCPLRRWYSLPELGLKRPIWPETDEEWGWGREHRMWVWKRFYETGYIWRGFWFMDHTDDPFTPEKRFKK